MEQIKLINTSITSNTLTYHFTVTKGLSQYFSGKPFVIEYPCDISSVPQSVAAVPFVCNVLPLIWLTDSELVLEELDRAFFESIPNFKAGYEAMFPESNFAGNIQVARIVDCDMSTPGRCAAFFSGGLDATQTLVSHFDEKPDLISIWGSDISYDNREGWETVHKEIADIAERYGLEDAMIRSSFRLFDSEINLQQDFSVQLKDSWWHGVKHGIALIGHAAPYAYVNGLSTVYIASSNCPLDGPVRCASHPTIDSHVRFANCQVVHDGFEFSRQDKVRNVAKFQRTTGHKITLHVCWESQSGGNCCHCEKCYRTMTGLIAEGCDPADFGFEASPQTMLNMKIHLLNSFGFNASVAKRHWKHVQRSLVNNQQAVKETRYWNSVRWLLTADLDHFETLKLPLLYRIRRKLSTFRTYQLLHTIKARILK